LNQRRWRLAARRGDKLGKVMRRLVIAAILAIAAAASVLASRPEKV
jgi:hypothetical protein